MLVRSTTFGAVPWPKRLSKPLRDSPRAGGPLQKHQKRLRLPAVCRFFVSVMVWYCRRPTAALTISHLCGTMSTFMLVAYTRLGQEEISPSLCLLPRSSRGWMSPHHSCVTRSSEVLLSFVPRGIMIEARLSMPSNS